VESRKAGFRRGDQRPEIYRIGIEGKESTVRQELRAFIQQMETERPAEVVHVREEVDPKYEVTAVMLEAERNGHYPLFLFEHIKGYDIPVVTGVISHRNRFADALGVPVEQASYTYIQRSKNRIVPRDVGKAPFHANVQRGNQVDLTKFPILTYFPVDPAPYITAAMVVTCDPVTGTNTLGYHRCMLKGKTEFCDGEQHGASGDWRSARDGIDCRCGGGRKF